MKLLNSLVYLACTFILFSCSDEEQKTVAKKKTEFVYNERAALTSLDPAFAGNQANTWATSQLFNGLVTFDKELSIVPDLAYKWDISEDGKTYEFQLRKGVKFHDHELFPEGKGRDVTAHDFVYSFKRIIDTTTGYNQGMWIFADKIIRDWRGKIIDSCFKAVDDYTFRVYLKKPSPQFMGILAMTYASVIPKEIAEHYGKEFRVNPIGTGPFKFVHWKEGRSLIYHKNEHYWKKDDKGVALPYLDAVRVQFLADKKQAYRAFLMKKIDFISGVEPNTVDEIFNQDGTISTQFKSRYDVEKLPYLNTEYLGFQLDSTTKGYKPEYKPFYNKKFRKALNFALDKTKLIRYLRNNVGIPAEHGVIPPFVPGYESGEVKGYSFDPDKALRLFKESGVTRKEVDGLKISTTDEYKDLIAFVVKQWEDVLGVKIKIDIVGASVYYKLIKEGETPFFRASWLGDYPDAENYLTLFYSPNFSPNGPNKTHFKSYKVDRLYEKAIRTLDKKERNLVYQEVDQEIMNQSPIIPLFYDEVIRMKQKNIKNFPANAMNLLMLESVIKE